MEKPSSPSEVLGDSPSHLVCSELMALAIDVMGNQDMAKAWFHKPALGLSGAKPIDLLSSEEGSWQVKAFLQRMQFGVYQ